MRGETSKVDRVAKILFFGGGKCFRFVLKEPKVDDNNIIKYYSLNGRLAGVRFEKSTGTRAGRCSAVVLIFSSQNRRTLSIQHFFFANISVWTFSSTLEGRGQSSQVDLG